MAAVEKRLLFIVMGFALLFGFKMSAQAEESVVGAEPKYVIYVNRTENCVTVMEQQPDGTETVAKVMACSCGKVGHKTPQGTFYTSDYYDWRLLVDGSYGRYAVRFNNRILFHSVPYTKKSPDALKWDQYNLLGENASLGCVRLAVEDAKWIYDNCKQGTQVTVYSGEEIVGGVTKPDALKIAEDSPYRGWDPTDLTPGNPWFDSDSEAVASSQQESLKTSDYVAYADTYEFVNKASDYNRKPLHNRYMAYGVDESKAAETRTVENKITVNRIAGNKTAENKATQNKTADNKIAENKTAINKTTEYGSGRDEFSQLKSIETFDYVAYADRYDDVKEAFGYDRKALYDHYITYGIKEGRKAEFVSDSNVLSQLKTVESFDYVAYADRYADVKEAFGYNRAALYNHYLTYGINEGRIAEFG